MQNKKSFRLFLLGAIVGGGLLIAAKTSLEYTSTMSFCISCHEMEQTVYQEYLRSPHYKSASGVGAECQDCHVPRELGAKLVRKVNAVKEVYHSLIGTISTPEKFEMRRPELAERVWAEMEANDSSQCRYCHIEQRMDHQKQSRRAQEKMEPGLREGKTCIECHKGIAHSLPEDDEDD